MVKNRLLNKHTFCGGGIFLYCFIMQGGRVRNKNHIMDKVVNMRGTYSKLEIDSEDCSVYIAQSGTMLYELHLDYF